MPPAFNELTHWGRVTHLCVSKLNIIGSDNALAPGRRQAIIWTNARILLIGPLGTNFSGMLFEYHRFSFKKMHFKMSSWKWQPFCVGLNVLRLVVPLVECIHYGPHFAKQCGSGCYYYKKNLSRQNTRGCLDPMWIWSALLRKIPRP